MTNSNYDPESATRAWLRRQQDIVRIAKHIPTITVRYEDLCRRTNNELRRIHAFADLESRDFDGDFKHSTHHILGNRMRLGEGRIKLDERWRQTLDPEVREVVERRLFRFAASHTDDPAAAIIRSYLEEK
jgi:hypothetical protein